MDGCELVLSDRKGGLQPRPTTLALGHYCFRLGSDRLEREAPSVAMRETQQQRCVTNCVS